MLTKELTSAEKYHYTPELNVTCEAAGCFAKATNRIAVKVGNLGVILLLLCSKCVTKFQEAEQK